MHRPVGRRAADYGRKNLRAFSRKKTGRLDYNRPVCNWGWDEIRATISAADFPAARDHPAATGDLPGDAPAACHAIRHPGACGGHPVRNRPSEASAGVIRANRARDCRGKTADGRPTHAGLRSDSCHRDDLPRLRATPAPDASASGLGGAILPIPEVRSVIPAGSAQVRADGRTRPAGRQTTGGGFRENGCDPRRGVHRRAFRYGGAPARVHPAPAKGGGLPGGHPGGAVQAGGLLHGGPRGGAARDGGFLRGGPRDSRPAACQAHGAAGLAIGNLQRP